MSIIYHTVFAEAHCNEQSLSYYCPVCNQFCCSHCPSGSMYHDWTHICVHNEIEHRVEIENEIDEEDEIDFQEIDDDIDDDENDFDEEQEIDFQEIDDDENDYILDDITSHGNSYPQNLTHCDRNI